MKKKLVNKNINKNRVKINFSRHAKFYDEYSSIQNLCAKKLISKIKDKGINRILDIGCGTGNYTQMLRQKFPKANIEALDISKKMIEKAKEKLKNENIKFIIDDAETANINKRFDLISSNASFQWFVNLENTLKKYANLLNENGVVLFSFFGPQTFYELKESLNIFSKKNVLLSANEFETKGTIEIILNSLFKKVEIKEEIYSEKYISLMELLKKIKYTGTSGNGYKGDNFWTSKMIKDVEKVYLNNFKNIISNYQVFFCQGIKRISF